MGNYASGNARVGIQAQTIHGGAINTSDLASGTRDLDDLLQDLRQLIDIAANQGRIDTESATSAREELETVSSTAADTPTRITAMKRMRGLFLDHVDIAAKVATVLGFLQVQ